jgi:hypothetical protein
VLVFRREKRTQGLDLRYCGSSSVLNKHEPNISTGLDKVLKEIGECPKDLGVKQSKNFRVLTNAGRFLYSLDKVPHPM